MMWNYFNDDQIYLISIGGIFMQPTNSTEDEIVEVKDNINGSTESNQSDSEDEIAPLILQLPKVDEPTLEQRAYLLRVINDFAKYL